MSLTLPLEYEPIIGDSRANHVKKLKKRVRPEKKKTFIQDSAAPTGQAQRLIVRLIIWVLGQVKERICFFGVKESNNQKQTDKMTNILQLPELPPNAARDAPPDKLGPVLGTVLGFCLFIPARRQVPPDLGGTESLGGTPL